MGSVAAELIAAARAAGLTLEADGDRLAIRGPHSAAGIVQRLRDCKAEIIAALHACAEEAWCQAHPGTVPLWLYDRLYPDPTMPPMTPPAHLSAEEVERRVAEVQAPRGHPVPDVRYRQQSLRGENR